MSHRTFARTLSLIVALTAALILGLAATASAAPASCAEDAPCWTWSIHGDQHRGVTLKDGRRLAVGVCRFQRLVAARRIDWKLSARLRGDWTALHYFDCD